MQPIGRGLALAVIVGVIVSTFAVVPAVTMAASGLPMRHLSATPYVGQPLRLLATDNQTRRVTGVTHDQPALRLPTSNAARPRIAGRSAPAPHFAGTAGLSAVSSSTGVSSTPGFQGISQCGLCGEPPDPWVAAGATDVIQAVNTSIRVSTRAGATLATVPFGSFFGEPVGQVVNSDPRVLWDAAHGRWIASELSFDCSSGHLYIAVSSGADPMAAWTSYRFDFPGEIPDYPALASSSDKVVLSANEFAIVPSGGSCGGSAFTGATLLIVDWSDLLSGGSLLGSSTTPDPTLFTWRPATALSATSTLPAVVGIANGAALDVGYATISGTNAGGTVAVSAVQDLTTAGIVAGFADPPTPHGATGFTSGTIDGRPTDALWQNGILWIASTYPCVPPGDVAVRDCVRATSFETGTPTPTAVQDFLAGASTYDFFSGGIGLGKDGTLYLVFSAASASTHISTYATAQRPGDLPNTFRSLTLLVAGAATYSGTRWGDYVGVAQDPTEPNGVWQGDEYPNGSGGWSTKITNLSMDATPPTGSFSLAGGAPSTRTPSISITDSATDTGTGVAAMRVSNDGSTWDTLSYATTFAWDLTSPAYGGTASNGVKTVTMEWQDGAGNWSDPVQHSITLITGSTYHAISPTRLLDTRVANGLSGTFKSNIARTFQVTGRGGVPAGATAVTGNLTVTQQTAVGSLFIGPLATNNPTSSTLNFPKGDNRANGVTVALGSGGKLSITYVAASSASQTQAIFDVTGYFTAAASGSTYHAISPTRLLDTRVANGLSGTFKSKTARTFQVTGRGGVPAGATAVTGNLTVTQQTAAGFLFIGPAATNNPTSSTLNFPKGDNRANGVTVALSGSGTLSVTYVAASSASQTQAIFDVTGYFTAAATGSTYHAISPTRLLDTRVANGLSGTFKSKTARTFQVTGRGGVPAGATAVTGNLTVTQQTAAGFLFIGPAATNNPTSSTLNFPKGDNRANGVTVALSGSGTLSITYVAASSASQTQAIFDVTGYFTAAASG